MAILKKDDKYYVKKDGEILAELNTLEAARAFDVLDNQEKTLTTNTITHIQLSNMLPIAVQIQYNDGEKRGWDLFKSKLKGTEFYEKLNLRKSSMDNVTLMLESNCCGDKLEVRRKKDFPTDDLKCNCGKSYLVKWELNAIH